MRTLQYLKASAATVLLFILGLLTTTKTWAQEGSIDVDIDRGGGPGPNSYVWIALAAVAVFGIVIAAIVSSSNKT